MIGNIRQRDSSKAEFKKHKMLRLPDIYQHSAIIFMFRYENNLLPPIFENLFQQNRDIHHHFTRNQNKLRQPRINSKIAERYITNMGPKLWNELDGNVCKNTSLAVFKRSLLIWLIDKYA